VTTTARPRRAAGRPPKIAGGATRWWLYVNPDRRARAEQRAAREGVELPDVLRAFLDAYAAGTAPAPTPTPEETP
jgi:hypothetical protein